MTMQFNRLPPYVKTHRVRVVNITPTERGLADQEFMDWMFKRLICEDPDPKWPKWFRSRFERVA